MPVVSVTERNFPFQVFCLLLFLFVRNGFICPHCFLLKPDFFVEVNSQPYNILLYACKCRNMTCDTPAPQINTSSAFLRAVAYGSTTEGAQRQWKLNCQTEIQNENVALLFFMVLSLAILMFY